MTNILVVGGAGYIGSHTCLDLASKGFSPIVYDNLSNGHQEFVQWGPLEKGDLHDERRLEKVFEKYRPAAVIHFAGLIEVGESVKDPASFYRNNVAGTLSLLQVAQAAGVNKFVFSSTCATYGIPRVIPIPETHPQAPINPYGHSKLMVEQILRDLNAHCGMRSVILRYFNAAGADLEARIGEWHEPETHAVPLAIEAALGRRKGFKIFGTDYDTRDGTCVRDYIHVLDLADAHSRAVQHLLDGGETAAVNLGTGTGTTVKELIATIKAVTGRDFRVDVVERRKGDSPVLVADNSKARDVLGWSPRYSLEDIIASAWKWHSGYDVT